MPAAAGSADSAPTRKLRSGSREPVDGAGWNDSGLTDADLLSLCRSGDQQSWTALVRRYARLVTTVAEQAGLPPSDVEDVTQATFIALLESGTRLRQDQRLSAWLLTVAQRKSWQARHRLTREELVTAPHPAETAEDPDGPEQLSPAHELPQETWERVADLEGALARLGSPCRDLLEALYLDPDMPSYAEIATRLRRPIGTIGPTRGRCLAKLRHLIGEDIW